MTLTGFFKPETIRRRKTPTAFSTKSRCTIAGVGVDRLTMEEATAKIVHALQRRSSTSPLLIMGPNAQLITLAQKDIHFAEALRASELNVPDGISVVLASKILGSNISKRVPGGELMEHLCREAAQHKLSIFLLGGLPGAATIAAAQLQQRYPDLCIAGTYCPPFKFEHDPVESAHVRELIAEASPDLLFVALGAPRQEIWMHQNCSTLPIGAAMSVGAAFDTLAGFRRRAPLWTQRLGMEWLYRLVQEPRRLWRRYLIGNTHFIFLILKQLLIHGRLPLQEEQVPVNISRELSPGCPPHQTACGS